jgi:hypothetical protein
MRLVLIVCVIGFLLLPDRVTAAFEPFLTGPRSAGLAGAAGAAKGDLWAGSQNPAGFDGLRHLTVGVWTAPSIFGIAGLGRAGCVVGVPISGWTVGAQVSSFGLENYRETSVSLSAAAPLSSGIVLGLRINGLFLKIAGYGSAFALTCDAGIRIELADRLAMSCLLMNATGSQIGSSHEALPLVLALTCEFVSPAAGLSCYATCSRELLAPVEWNVGIEYATLPELRLRCGIGTDPALVCAGLGITVAPVSFDYAVTHHWQLGSTHHISLSVELD